MKAFVSGAAGVAVVVGQTPHIRTFDGKVHNAWHPADALRVFDGCTDVRVFENLSSEELEKRTLFAWAEDRALRLFLLLLDPDEPELDLAEYAGCVSELLAEHAVQEALEARLFAASLPISVDVSRVETACRAEPAVWALVARVLELQALIGRVQSAFNSLSLTVFDGDRNERAELREVLIREGWWRAVVLQLASDSDLSFLKLKMLSAHRFYGSAISALFDVIQPNTKKAPKELREAVSTEEWEEFDEPSSDPKVFADVRSRQHAILMAMKKRDVESARTAMAGLIAFQQVSSSAEQIGKTFCNMATRAKEQEVPELQLEWAKAATETNPIDPVTHGHLADALISIGDFGEAITAFEMVERFGDPVYAATGRARVKRMMGRPLEARADFLAAAAQYEGLPGVEHALIGAADTLREMNDPEQAVIEFEALCRSFPLEVSAWSGLAGAYMDLGRVDEAIKIFGKAAGHGRATQILIARASAYRRTGAFDDAHALLDVVLEKIPNNSAALCGKSEIFRLQGNLDRALVAYDEAIEKSPYTPRPVSGKANLLLDLERIEEALALFAVGADRFAYQRSFRIGRAEGLKAAGRYEEALSVLDGVVSDYPFDTGAQIARALVLQRLGSDDDAMSALEVILAAKPYEKAAQNARIALLIKRGMYDRAALHFGVSRPRTQAEWRRYVLRALSLDRQFKADEALRILRDGIARCPFFLVRRTMRDTVASLEMRKNRRLKAREIVEDAPREVSNVIALRVLASTNRMVAARERLRLIQEAKGPASIIELAEEIARRHKLVGGLPQHQDDWITRIEEELLLAQAA